MRDSTLKVALAGLLHDMGKFAQGCMELEPGYREANESLYQPLHDGRYSHVHALYTAAFLERYAEYFPPECSSRNWGEGDILLNLAACHHKPETPMQHIVTVADWIASGFDRATFDQGKPIAWRDFKKTRLLPLLEALGPKRHQAFTARKDYGHAHALAPLSAQNIFAREHAEVSREDAEQEYRDLFNRFIQGLKELYHQDNVRLWAQHMDSLLMVHASLIPAARVNNVIPDVSLYDHCRITAALAAALYVYHKSQDSMDRQAIEDGSQEKFLMVSGDFYGIQDFIFAQGGESSQFRSKLLRGRSFSVSLCTDLAADMICEALDLPFFSVVLSAAGKFHILAPNTNVASHEIQKTVRKINDWLFARTYGQSSIGVTITSLCPNDLVCPRFRDFWQRHLDRMEATKHQKLDLCRHAGAVGGYLDSFDNQLGICPLCGKRPAHADTKGDSVFRSQDMCACRLCRDHVLLGTLVVKNSMLALCTAQAPVSRERSLLEPVFGHYQAVPCNGPYEDLARSGELLGLLELEAREDGSLASRATVRLINGHVPVYTEADNANDLILEGTRSEEAKAALIDDIQDGAPKTLNHIALMARRMEDGKAKGTEALGVLKADIDNLGMLFGCGFDDRHFTLSRMATLSRQINSFFTLYLPHLLRTSPDFGQVYTVFAGGDDLFLIGPWNIMPRLAAHLRQRFSDFVCGNPEITFSAGISLHKPHSPMDKMAHEAEEALNQAKRGQGPGRDRNRITLFGQTVTWEDFQRLMENREAMAGWLKRGLVSRVMFYRFNHFIGLAEEEDRLAGASSIPMSAMECVKWRAKFRYALARNVNTKTPAGDKALDEVGIMADWLTNYRGGMRIPLWQILYEERS